AHIKTIVIKQVAQETTRELDLQAAGKSGQAMAVDILPDSLYDVASKTSWLNNNQLVSDIPGVTLYGPYTYFSTLFDPFSTNVTNPFTGSMYAFQPFADLRFRTAFADAVNMTSIMINVNNKLGQVATSVVPPGMNPQGTYNSSITPAYSFNPYAVQTLLLSAMQSPITSFHYKNGTAAASSAFNNAFGCNPLPSSGKCVSPTLQSIVLYDAQGDTVDAAILNQIATVVQNVSTTYNMGLTVSVSLVPSGTLVTQGTSGQYYMYALGWFADYPWVVDFLNPMYAPGGAYTGGDGWNLTSLKTLGAQAVAATAIGNSSGLVKVTNMMNQIANSQVMYLWTQYPIEFLAMTSNVQGFYFNPALSTDTGNVAGPQLFAPLS
ncbi:MAG: ABC transporter substrate-binding protein, partial [Nitrososphaerales archaeon]